ncbi:pseudouridine synthase [uncultured Sphingomonas sp.]|uniref:pseudouridine synthase n=1 Tax=uncultured Sphingomonas sp. TaxID=158754 RepID=UPI0035CBAAAA
MTTRIKVPRAETDTPRDGDRIAKLLARAGIASRREVERMIAEGRIAIDGVVLDTPATVLTSLAGVTVDGNPVQAAEPTRLFLYHKPAGLLVTERDPKGRPTIYEHLPDDLPRVVPVGRLDLATEGLLLLTTDGGFKRQLELPSTGVERAYRARAYGQVTQAQLEDLAEGVEIEGIRYGSIDANIERRTGANVWIEMILTEGKNREVRRVLENLELQVSRLIRTRYGPFVLGELGPGEVGEVGEHDLAAFRRALGDVRHGRSRDDSPDATIAVEARSKPRAAATPSKPRPVDRAPRSAGPARQEPGARRFRTERSTRAGEALTTRPPRADDRRPSAGAAAQRPARPRGDGDAVAAPPKTRRGTVRPDRPAHTGRNPDGDGAASRGTRGAARRSDAPAADRPGKSSRPAKPAGSARIRADGTAASDKRPRSTRPAPGKGPAGGRGRPSRTPRDKTPRDKTPRDRG